jgi:hypothetical protein
MSQTNGFVLERVVAALHIFPLYGQDVFGEDRFPQNCDFGR